MLFCQENELTQMYQPCVVEIIYDLILIPLIPETVLQLFNNFNT